MDSSGRCRRSGGLPHSDIHGSGPADGSPWLFAVCRVLLRLTMPRHPSCARIRLARNFSLSRYVAILFNSSSLFKDRMKGAVPPLVGLTGVEPVTSSLSGTRSNQLSYKPFWVGGGSRIRTGGMLLAKQPLYQLSYTPRRGPRPARKTEGRRNTDRTGNVHGRRRAPSGAAASNVMFQLRDLDGPCSLERR